MLHHRIWHKDIVSMSRHRQGADRRGSKDAVGKPGGVRHDEQGPQSGTETVKPLSALPAFWQVRSI